MEATRTDEVSDMYQCPICAELMRDGDMCQTDYDMGTCHATCLEGATLVDLSTGDPLPEGTPWPAPYRFADPLRT